MTPIPFPLPAGRILPPTTAYAAGLICERRPDLADGVRSAVLGDAALTALDVMTLARVEAADKQGANALAYLREIVHYGGNDPKALHGLADVLGLIPAADKVATIIDHDGEERVGAPTICDVWHAADQHFIVCGLGGSWLTDRPLLPPHHEQFRAHRGALVLQGYLRDGLEWVWGDAELDAEHEALRRLIPIHAHTVSLDPDARAAWAKAHLDALGAP